MYLRLGLPFESRDETIPLPQNYEQDKYLSGISLLSEQIKTELYKDNPEKFLVIKSYITNLNTGKWKNSPNLTVSNILEQINKTVGDSIIKELQELALSEEDKNNYTALTNVWKETMTADLLNSIASAISNTDRLKFMCEYLNKLPEEEKTRLGKQRLVSIDGTALCVDEKTHIVLNDILNIKNPIAPNSKSISSIIDSFAQLAPEDKFNADVFIFTTNNFEKVRSSLVKIIKDQGTEYIQMAGRSLKKAYETEEIANAIRDNQLGDTVKGSLRDGQALYFIEKFVRNFLDSLTHLERSRKTEEEN
jgi:hypothetical protein